MKGRRFRPCHKDVRASGGARPSCGGSATVAATTLCAPRCGEFRGGRARPCRGLCVCVSAPGCGGACCRGRPPAIPPPEPPSGPPTASPPYNPPLRRRRCRAHTPPRHPCHHLGIGGTGWRCGVHPTPSTLPPPSDSFGPPDSFPQAPRTKTRKSGGHPRESSTTVADATVCAPPRVVSATVAAATVCAPPTGQQRFRNCCDAVRATKWAPAPPSFEQRCASHSWEGSASAATTAVCAPPMGWHRYGRCLDGVRAISGEAATPSLPH